MIESLGAVNENPIETIYYEMEDDIFAVQQSGNECWDIEKMFYYDLQSRSWVQIINQDSFEHYAVLIGMRHYPRKLTQADLSQIQIILIK